MTANVWTHTTEPTPGTYHLYYAYDGDIGRYVYDLDISMPEPNQLKIFGTCQVSWHQTEHKGGVIYQLREPFTLTEGWVNKNRRWIVETYNRRIINGTD